MKYKFLLNPLHLLLFSLVFMPVLRVSGVHYDQVVVEKCLRIIKKCKLSDTNLEKIKETALLVKSKKQRGLLEDAMRGYIQVKRSKVNYSATRAFEEFTALLNRLESPELSEESELLSDEEILEKYLPLLTLDSIKQSKAHKIKNGVLSMEDHESQRLLQDAIRCFIIRTACDTEQDSERDAVVEIFLNKELLFPSLSERPKFVGLDPNGLGLPNEVLGNIFSFLRPRDLCSITRACIAWHHLSQHELHFRAIEGPCKKKDKESVLKLLKQKSLSPRELDLVWDTFVEPINQKGYAHYSGRLSEELNVFNGLFAKQLLRLIQNNVRLNIHFEWIIKSIERIKDIQIQQQLLMQICARYQGGDDNRVGLIFRLIDSSLSNHGMVRNNVIMAIAQNPELMNNNLTRILACSQPIHTTGLDGVLERFKTIGRYYTGDPKLLLDYVEKQITTSGGYNCTEVYSIYRGLLMNEKLGPQCYHIIASNIKNLRKNEYRKLLLKILWRKYETTNPELVLETTGDNLTILNGFYPRGLCNPAGRGTICEDLLLHEKLGPKYYRVVASRIHDTHMHQDTLLKILLDKYIDIDPELVLETIGKNLQSRDVNSLNSLHELLVEKANQLGIEDKEELKRQIVETAMKVIDRINEIHQLDEMYANSQKGGDKNGES